MLYFSCVLYFEYRATVSRLYMLLLASLDMFPDIPFNAWTFHDSAYFLCPSLTFMKKTVSIYYRKYYIMTAFFREEN
jgi:hypothetical protein